MPEWGSVWGSVEFKKGKIADAGRYCNRESGITETGVWSESWKTSNDLDFFHHFP